MKYYNMLDMPHFHAPGKPYMSLHNRAAQFMPFKSLNAYHDDVSVKEDEILGAKWQRIIYDESDQNFAQDDDGDDGRFLEK